jgi:dihydrolipoamide dehydrogenase
VGLSEAQAASAGYEVLTGKFPLAASGRALTMGETDGYIKVVADKKSHALLGASIIGAEASELIAEATLAIEMGAVVEDIGMTIHAHPSLAESFMEAAKATIGEAIHVLQK